MKKKFAVALLLALLLTIVCCVALADTSDPDDKNGQSDNEQNITDDRVTEEHCPKTNGAHEWSDWYVVNTDADCQTIVKEERYCTKCNYVSKTTRDAGYGAHKYVTLEDTQATCHSQGRLYKVCSVCGDEIEEIYGVTRHNYQSIDKGVVVKGHEATCLTEGLKLVYCTNPGCTAFTEKPYGPLGHAFVRTATITQETCTTPGEAVQTCSRCGKVETFKPAALGHDYRWVVIEKGDCAHDEYSARQCSRCGDWEDGSKEATRKLTKSKAEYAHVWDKGTVLVDPDPATGRAGQIKYVCTVKDCPAVRIEPYTGVSEPTTAPSTEPTTAPSTEPTTAPTTKPTTAPTTKPTKAPSGNNGHTSSNGGGDAAQPATGDNSNNVAYVVAIVAMLGLAVAAFSRKKVNG